MRVSVVSTVDIVMIVENCVMVIYTLVVSHIVVEVTYPPVDERISVDETGDVKVGKGWAPRS